MNVDLEKELDDMPKTVYTGTIEGITEGYTRKKEFLYFDIETYKWFKNDEHKNLLGEELRDHRKKDTPENREEGLAKAALSPISGQVLVVGFLEDDIHSTISVFDGMDEREVILHSMKYISQALMTGKILVSKGGKRFDLPYLLERALILNIQPEFKAGWNILLNPYSPIPHIDYENILSRPLGVYGYLLGKVSQMENPGSEIGGWYEAGEYDKIIEKNKDDLLILKEINERLQWLRF